MSDVLPYLEDSIAKRLANIENKIKDLSREKSALERLLLEARRENVQNKEAVRRNSTSRILVENSILKTLRRSPSAVSNKDLYLNAKAAVYSLKDSTFRSHIKRMKDAEKIVAKGNRWILPETK